jgi:hypothetical protein
MHLFCQVKQNKTEKNWARYSIVDDLANKYKQLSANSNQMIHKQYSFYLWVKSVGLKKNWLRYQVYTSQTMPNNAKCDFNNRPINVSSQFQVKSNKSAKNWEKYSLLMI